MSIVSPGIKITYKFSEYLCLFKYNKDNKNQQAKEISNMHLQGIQYKFYEDARFLHGVRIVFGSILLNNFLKLPTSQK